MDAMHVKCIGESYVNAHFYVTAGVRPARRALPMSLRPRQDCRQRQAI